MGAPDHSWAGPCSIRNRLKPAWGTSSRLTPDSLRWRPVDRFRLNHEQSVLWHVTQRYAQVLDHSCAFLYRQQYDVLVWAEDKGRERLSETVANAPVRRAYGTRRRFLCWWVHPLAKNDNARAVTFRALRMVTACPDLIATQAAWELRHWNFHVDQLKWFTDNVYQTHARRDQRHIWPSTTACCYD